MIKKIVVFMLMSFCFMGFGAYANTIVNTAIINTVVASSVIDDPIDEPSEQVVKKKEYNVSSMNDYLLSVCTPAQAQAALAWQSLCRAGKDFNRYCPVISYQRYCQPATAKDVQGLKPLKPQYRNVFLRD